MYAVSINSDCTVCTDWHWADTVVGPYENNGSCGEAAKFVRKRGYVNPEVAH